MTGRRGRRGSGRSASGRGALLALGLAAALASPGAAAERGPRANYVLRCAGCHGMEGAGTVIGGVPSFHGSVATLANDDLGRTYMLHVPGVTGASLSDPEIAAVLTYVVERWGAAPAPAFTAEEVARRRAEPVADVVALRRAIALRLGAEGKPLADYPWP